MTPDDFTINETWLDVGDEHKIYLHEWGTPSGEPIFFLHGGPGNGCSDRNKAFFNPNKHRVIFHDQRGSGKSLAYGNIEHNSTEDLIGDITKIADHLKLDHFILSGGSWGSCLALVYAINNPSRVKNMVLFGIFTGSQEEREWLFNGNFKPFYPDVWQKYLDSTPVEHRKDPSGYHLKNIVEGNIEEQKRSAHVLSNMEYALIGLDDRRPQADYENFDAAPIVVEAHYSAHDHFLPDNFVFANAKKLTMPITLIQGHYDMVCGPFYARKLQELLPNGQLLWTVAGHSSQDRGNYDVIRSVLNQFGKA